MGRKTSHLGWRALSFVLTAACACLPEAAAARDGAVDLVSPESFTLYGDVRLVAVDGEQAWVNGGFGKLRYGGDNPSQPSDLRIQPQLGEVGIVWQPRFGWSVSGTVVALAEGGDTNNDGKLDAGLSEAYLSFKPLDGGPIKVSARAGLMWPPVSIEHSGPEWAVTDTITPSAIGSWIGEEVKIIGLEVTGKGRLGGHEIAVTIAGFDVNDTAGALLTFRGWALHDRKALAFRKQPLPPLNEFMEYVQPRYSHPLLNLDHGLFKRPGYYAKLAWTAPIPVHGELLHYDNNGDPEAVNADLEWGWRTKFDSLGLVADLGGGRELRAQGLSGHTRMGYPMGGQHWIDMRFRAAFGMFTQRFDRSAITARLDLFSTRNHGSAVELADDEDGWAVTVAAKRELRAWLTGFIEYLHVESNRDARTRASLMPDQAQNQVQMVMRAHW
jgi:hypothetical protein